MEVILVQGSAGAVAVPVRVIVVPAALATRARSLALLGLHGIDDSTLLAIGDLDAASVDAELRQLLKGPRVWNLLEPTFLSPAGG